MLLVRHALTFVGGSIGMDIDENGVRLASDAIDVALGGAITAAGVIWSYRQKKGKAP
jgi:surface antigen